MRGRPKLPYPVKRVTFRLSEEVANAYQAFLYDPTLGRPSYGLSSAIVERLLRDMMAALKEGQTTMSLQPVVKMLASKRRA